MTGSPNKAIVTGILVASANAVAGIDAGQTVTCNQIANLNGTEIANAISEEFQLVHGLNLDWNTALEVSDDEEGKSSVFSSDSGHSIRVSIENVRFAAPNKFDADN